MNNQEKFTTRSSKVKVHRTNSQTILSYPVRFSTDILFSSLVSFFAFLCLLVFLLQWLKLKIYVLIHIWLCGRVNDKEILSQPISVSKITFFCLHLHMILFSNHLKLSMHMDYLYFLIRLSEVNKALI